MTARQQHFITNKLRPLKKSSFESSSPRFEARQKNAPRVYEYLRSRTGRRPLAIATEAREVGLPRNTFRRALETLERVSCMKRTSTSVGDEWEVLPWKPFLTRPRSFRGHSEILLSAKYTTLTKELSEHERRALYLSFRSEKGTVALYLHLRRLWAGQEDGVVPISHKLLAQQLACMEQTITHRLRRLAECEFVELDHGAGDILLLPAVATVDERPLDADSAAAFFDDPALQPPLGDTERNALAMRKKTIGSQASLVLDFFYKATAAKGSKTDIGMAHAGAKVANERAARNLVRDATFKQLMGPLLFFVVDWAGEAVDNYGRTLVTFQKNLPAILEEYADNSTDRTYIQRLMKRMGLDAHFPVPEVKQPAQRRPDLEIEDWEAEDYVPPVQKHKPRVLTPEELRAQRAAFAKAISYG